MTPETVSALLDEFTRRDDGALTQKTLQHLKKLSREGYQRVCSTIAPKVRSSYVDGKINVVIDQDVVGRAVEIEWLAAEHEADAEQLLLRGASRDVVSDVTGLHTRDISKLRAMLVIKNGGSSRQVVTVGDQKIIKRLWDEYEGLNDAKRLLALRADTDIPFRQIWEVVRKLRS